jgi:hypothetical protein
MKRLTFLLITFFTVGSYSGPTWADSVYECIGNKGEASFSSKHCNVAPAESSSTDRAKYAAHDRRLEQLKSERAELKRKLMDLKREYNYTVTRVPAESEPALTLQYEQQTLSLNAEIKLLDEKQTLLVGQSFDELLQAKAGS